MRFPSIHSVNGHDLCNRGIELFCLKGKQNSVLVLLGKGKLLFGNSGLSFSRPFSTLGGVHLFIGPCTVFAAKSDFHLFSQQRNLSFVGAHSITFSIRSVSSPSVQICKYHIGLLSESSQISLGSPFQKTPMVVACSSKAVLHDCCLDKFTLMNDHLSNSANRAGLSYSCRSLYNCRKTSMSLRNQKPSNRNLVYGYFIFDVMRRSCNSYPLPESRKIHNSPSSGYSARAAPDVPFDGSRDEQLASSTVSSDQIILDVRALKLLSGSCYLPHPDKEETGGEDAYFICVDEQAIGVADGVGGWRDLGIDSGLYARELMSNSITAIKEEPKGAIDLTRVLEKAHLGTKAQGSCTACIIALTDQVIQALNLGDSGFIVIREGRTVFQSPVQQHGFNFPYQLDSGNDGDLPSSGQVFNIPVAPGDVIVAGTDGLFDNLYTSEVTTVVVHAIRTGLGPQVTAQKIAALARQRALDSNRQTPFSTAAQNAGLHYYGGKLDDITVVVSYITGSSNV